MTDETKREPVDNSHRDAGIAAREAQKESNAAADQPKPQAEQDAPQKVEASDAADGGDHGDETQKESGESADLESGDAPAQQSRKKPGVHQRIDELTREKHDERRAREAAERDREYWREQAMRQQGQQPQKSTESAPAAAAVSDEPTLESCDFDTVSFQRKWYDWRRNEDKKVETAQERARKFEERESAFRADHPDYDSVARNPALPITPQVAEVILETDDPPAIAYYLGQNPQEAAAIAQMTPHQIGRAIGRIEAKLSAPIPATDPQRQPEPKTISKAPAPVTNLSGSPAVHKSLADMSMREYDAQRRKDRLAKGLSP